jgi:dipeptidyl aminopeptidase/acylaminoacyl peptidase
MRLAVLALVLLALIAGSVLPSVSAQQNPLSRIGGKLAYISTDDDLMVMDGATGNRRLLVSGANQQLRDPRWSPDGGEIAYLSAPRIENPALCPGCLRRDFDVYTISANGGAPRKLTDRSQNMHRLVWFPDARRLMYQTGFNGDFRIHTINIDGTAEATFPLPSGVTYTDQFYPSPSPDSSRVAFLQSTGFGTGTPCEERSGYSLIVTDAAGQSAKDLAVTCAPFGPVAPQWSPDGLAIAFSDGSKLDEVTVDNSARRTVVDFAAESGYPSSWEIYVNNSAYSPINASVAIAVRYMAPYSPGSSLSSQDTVALWRRDGTSLRQISDVSGPLQWSSNGSSVLMVRAASNSSALTSNTSALVMATSGETNAVEIVRGRDFDWHS